MTAPPFDFSRRHLLLATGFGVLPHLAVARAPDDNAANLAPLAQASCAGSTTRDMLAAMNNGYAPPHSRDRRYEIWTSVRDVPGQWAEYRWRQPVQTRHIEVYWGQDDWETALPVSCRLTYWDGKAFRPVRGATGPGLAPDGFNSAHFEPVTTTRLRLEVVAPHDKCVGILQWRVWSHGALPDLPARVLAGVDRSVVVGGTTYLDGRVFSLKPSPGARWRKRRGPGEVVFDNPGQPVTTARVSQPGDYELELAGDGGRSTLQLRAVVAPGSRGDVGLNAKTDVLIQG